MTGKGVLSKWPRMNNWKETAEEEMIPVQREIIIRARSQSFQDDERLK